MSGPNGKNSLPDMQVSGPGGEPGAPGMVEMVIGTHEKRVIQRFRHPMLEVIYEPVNAALVGRELINRAVECGAMVQINVPRIKISREKHQALVARVAQITRSMVDQRKDPIVIGRAVVDQVLNQIENLGKVEG